MCKAINALSVLLLVLCSTLSYSQNRISGEIAHLHSDKIQLFLEEDINRKKRLLLAEIPVDKNGRFQYVANLSPNIYSLRINHTKTITLAIDKNQKVFIKGDLNDLQKWEVTGSADTKILIGYERFRKASLDSLVNSVRYQIAAIKKKGIPDTDTLLMKLTKLEVDNYERHRDELMNYIKKEMGTSIAIYATSIRWGGEKNTVFLLRLAEAFEKAHAGTGIAKKVREKVNVLAANTIGGKVRDINMPDREGKIVPLGSIKAKYILIDFWASWCAPCRRESPLLDELYQTFKSSGFEIYGVSMDSGKEAWLNAIEKDGRMWINVNTPEGFEGPVSFDYAVTSLPANVLIDQAGKVIAKNLHGNDLKNMVEKLFLKQANGQIQRH